MTTRITIADMAQRLNVSTATVANALNGRGRIGMDTVERVKALATSLHYVPNNAARQLKLSSSDTIGVFLNTTLDNNWYPQLVGCINKSLEKRGKTMMLGMGCGDPERTRHALRNFLGGKVAGVIYGPLYYQFQYNEISEFVECGVPTVYFNCIDKMPVNSVSINLAAGVEAAVDYLYGRGFRNIVYLACPASVMKLGTSANTRYAGFINAMKKHEMPVSEKSVIVSQGATIYETGVNAAGILMKRKKLPDAIFCHDDEVALGVISTLRIAGLNVPKDISMMGFDDTREASFSLPPLTTVGGIMEELSSSLVNVLFDEIAGRLEGDHIRRLITPKIIERGTVGSR